MKVNRNSEWKYAIMTPHPHCDHEGCNNLAKYDCNESRHGKFYLCESHWTSWMRDCVPIKLRKQGEQE